MKPFYITTTLPYVNGDPHVGFATEIVRADVLARDRRRQGREVFFNTGTDEHGQKIQTKADEQGIDPQELVDAGAEQFKQLKNTLNISWDRFIRTTDADHVAAAQEFWRQCDANGYIYKAQYQTKYCVGCELEKQDSDLNDHGRCPIHPDKEIELIDEENYFFRWSDFGQQLIDHYETHEQFVIPDYRFREIKTFVDGGLRDFSISRRREKMSWGIPVPNDDDHVMYVWFDALVDYISTLGWGSQSHDQFEKFWQEGETVQLCGKDNLRQQSAMWQAMLMSVGIKNTDHIFINGFINSGGQKMSKSLGNVIDPSVVVDRYGTDALRYFVLRHINNHEDSDWTAERFHENYMANLVNGLGNLVSRVLHMADKYEVSLEQEREIESLGYLERFDFNGHMNAVWKLIQETDGYISEEQPFKKAKDDLPAAQEDLRYLLEKLYEINEHLVSAMPETHETIKIAIQANKKPDHPLFPRIEFNNPNQ